MTSLIIGCFQLEHHSQILKDRLDKSAKKLAGLQSKFVQTQKSRKALQVNVRGYGLCKEPHVDDASAIQTER